MTLPDVVKRIGTARPMIGSDDPHPDGIFLHTVSLLRATERRSHQNIDNLLGGTAA